MPDILMIVTSQECIGDTGVFAGLKSDDFTVPYYQFKKNGFSITVASPLGGIAPAVDCNDSDSISQGRQFLNDFDARNLLNDTLRLDQIYISDFVGLYFCDGVGCQYDLYNNANAMRLIQLAICQNIPLAFCGYSVVSLLNIRISEQHWLLDGRSVAVVSSEDSSLQLNVKLSLLDLKNKVCDQGGIVIAKAQNEINVVRADCFITGQNTISGSSLVEFFIDRIRVNENKL
jgi:putative intracellular protease/amidase